jgi:hypothetical protein
MFTVLSRDYGTWVNGINLSITRDHVADTNLVVAGGSANYIPATCKVLYPAQKQTFTHRLKNGITILATNTVRFTIGAALAPDVFKYELMDAPGTNVVETHEINFTDVPTLQHLINWLNQFAGITAKVVGPAYFPSSILNTYAGTALVPAIPAVAYFYPAEEASLAYQLWALNPLLVPARDHAWSAPTPDGSIPLPTDQILSWSSSLYADMFNSGTPGNLPGTTIDEVTSANITGGAGSRWDDISTDTIGLDQALAMAESTECAYIWAQSCAENVQNLLKLHAESMSDVLKSKYRIYLTGLNYVSTSPIDGAYLAAATVDAAVLGATDRAPELNGPVVLAFNGSVYPNPLTGVPEQLGGLGLSAQLLGMAAGMPPGMPLTNKPITAQALEFPVLSDTQTDNLLLAGLTFPAFDPTDGAIKDVQALTCYQTSDPSFRLLHGLRIQHTVSRLWISVLAKYKGQPLDLEVGERIKADCANALDNSILNGSNPNGFLTEGKKNGVTLPAWDSLSVSGDTSTSLWTIDVNVHPVGETDYILVRTKFLPTVIELS